MDIQNISFSMLKDVICPQTLRAIEEMELKWPTEIQKRSIPHLLSKKDVIGVAKTGSGKTLAFLIPAVEYIYKKRFTSNNGTGCIIISPTRELAIQIYSVLKGVLKHHTMSCGLLIGGVNREKEVESISKGLNIVVATPGRLLDHLKNTKKFFYKNVKLLIIDEADKILDEGFEEEMRSIMKCIPRKNRQTVLFSATLNEKINLLSKLSLQNEPVHVSVDSEDKKSTVEGLQQGYVLCPTERRLWWLFKMLKKTKTQKVMVFLSSCKSVEFHRHLFEIFSDIPVMSIHGQQSQSKRTTTFSKFSHIDRGVLFCTDVAARGLDIPAVDWIVQYDPPTDTKEYIHRVGRTARGAGSTGNAVLVLRPEEVGFLDLLKKARVAVNPYKTWNKIEDIQAMVENVIATNGPMKILARKAFLGFLRSYKAHPLKDIFKITTLDPKALGKSFGFADPPYADILTPKKKKSAKKKQTKKKKNQADGE